MRRTVKRSRNRNRNQRGGNGWGFTGAAFNGIVPVESRASYNTCSAPQRGGCGCGIQLQMGGGTDGYSSNAAANELGKVPIYTQNPCVQRGGNAAQEYGVTSYSAGYGFSPVTTGAAGVPFMAVAPYGNSCMGGYRATRKSRGRKNKNRKTRSKGRK